MSGTIEFSMKFPIKNFQKQKFNFFGLKLFSPIILELFHHLSRCQRCARISWISASIFYHGPLKLCVITIVFHPERGAIRFLLRSFNSLVVCNCNLQITATNSWVDFMLEGKEKLVNVLWHTGQVLIFTVCEGRLFPFPLLPKYIIV